MGHPAYRSDKIVETLCEVRFVSGGEWDPTVFGSYYNVVKGEFPKKQVQEVSHVQVQAEQAGIRQTFAPPELRMGFLTNDESMMIQLARDLLVINVLKAYPSWSRFKPVIVRRAREYWETAKPKQICRVGLRYINRYEFPTGEFDVRKLFNIYPYVPERINGSASPFLVRVEHPFAEAERLILTFGETDSGRKDTVAVLLDLDHVFFELDADDVGVLEGKLELAHERVQGAFEACITDRIRALLDEGDA